MRKLFFASAIPPLLHPTRNNTASSSTPACMQQPVEADSASGAGVQIELQPVPMDRGRGSISRGRGAKKRATLPVPSHHGHAHAHSQSHSHSQPPLLPQALPHPPSLQSNPFSDSAGPSTPEPSALPSAHRMAYTAPQRGGKARHANTMTTPHRASSPAADQALRVTAASARADRPTRSLTLHPSSSFSFESPSASGSIMAAAGPARKRSRTFEASYDGAADDEGHSKGGHSLRKRARIDYTQEMIDDDLGLPAAKNDPAAVKPAATPSARGRKRKVGHEDSEEESEDLTSNPKRHRVDKSPAPARTLPPRRRNPSKKLSADLSTYVDQLSDNEVQDTILVSVPAGLVAASEAGSEHSSFRETESRPTSSDNSESARIELQPPSPHAQQPAPATETATPLAAEDDTAIGNQMIPGPRHNQPQIDHSHLSPTPTTETDQTYRAPEDDTKRAGFAVPTIVQEPEPIGPLDYEVRMTDADVEQQIHQAEKESSQPAAATEATLEIPTSTTAPTPEQKSAEDSTARLISQDPISGPTMSRTSSQRGGETTGPARFTKMERIYDSSHTPFASHRKLEPYENANSPLPGPYTEWVHSAAPVKDQSTPIPVPTPAPSLVERKTIEVEWDMRHPLKTSEFFALYSKESKRRKEKGEAPISMLNFNNECAQRYKAAHSNDDEASAAPSTTPESSASSTVVAEGPEAPAIPPTEEEATQDSQAAESRVPTAAPSPAPMDDAVAQDDVAEDEQDVDEPADDQVKPDSPGEPIEVTRYPHKQYLFPKIRDPNDFSEAFEGFQDFSTEHLYEVVAAGVEALHVYQQEYNELKKLLDDEENAKRRQANDKTVANWENRQKADEPLPFRRHFDDVVKGPPTFEVRGARAPKPYVDDPILEHQKEEDRIMAQAYGFKLNTHPTQVGRQNPEEQRWEMPENRLRRRTEKGAELAEENVVEGKRARKPRHVSDQSKDPSRAGTPAAAAVLVSGRRQRRKGMGAAKGDEAEGPEQTQFAESFSESPRKARAARARGMVLPDEQYQMTSVAEGDYNGTEDEEADADEKPKVSRRRGRGPAALPEAPTSVPTGLGGEVPKTKRLRGGKGQQALYQGGGEIATSSFYSNPSTQPDSRPSTSSSSSTAHTAETVESAYSLRDKRKRNFALENDPELETRPQRRARGSAAQKQEVAEPKKRGPRRKEVAALPPPPAPASAPSPLPAPPSPPPLRQPVATKFYHNFVAGPMMVDVGNGVQPVPMTHAAGPFMHTFNATPAFHPGDPPPPPAPPAVKKPMTKIKITNNGASSSQASSRAPTPANGTPGPKAGGKRSRGKKAGLTGEAKAAASANGDGDLDKPYAEMTKSEKMSWSMRSKYLAPLTLSGLDLTG